MPPSSATDRLLDSDCPCNRCAVQKRKPFMPKVSIIVPVYKSEEFIRECVDSALAQSYRDFELILVDDGSPDGCGRILDDYAAQDSRVKVVHQENGGPASARNAGLDIASGEFVYFPDSDDILDPGLLETVIPRFEEGYDMVVFGFSITPAPSKAVQENMRYGVSEETELILGEDEEKLAFIAGPFRRRAIRWEVWNRVFRRDVIEKWHIRFGCDRRIFAEDMYFVYFYLVHISRILLLPQRLYTYRKHEGSESKGYKKHLMIYSSNRMTEEFYGHCRRSEDCRYLYEHFLPIYYLLHKGAIRRLRRHQWRSGLSIEQAREVLKDNVVDYPVLVQRLTDMYDSPLVRESYKKDRKRLLQITDRLYTHELLELPGTQMGKKARSVLLGMLRAAGVQ